LIACKKRQSETKADFGGRRQIIFQATGELAGPDRRAKSAQATIAPETIAPAAASHRQY